MTGPNASKAPNCPECDRIIHDWRDHSFECERGSLDQAEIEQLLDDQAHPHDLREL